MNNKVKGFYIFSLDYNYYFFEAGVKLPTKAGGMISLGIAGYFSVELQQS
jgi:hypothetical protein